MSEPAKIKDLYDELCSFPDTVVGQIINGELIVTPRPSRRHAQAASTLGGEIVPPYQLGRGGGPGGWIIYDEPELHLGEDVLIPDLAGWRNERLTTPPEEHRFDIRPDWVCEILSPTTARQKTHLCPS